MLAIEAAESVEERLVPDKPAQHVDDQGALVVDEGAEDPRVVLDVPEPVAERDGTLKGVVGSGLLSRAK